jgi:hypothetical protein
MHKYRLPDLALHCKRNGGITRGRTRKKLKDRDSSLGIATGYGLDDRVIGVRFPEGAGNFSLRHHVQTGSGDHPASYPMGTGGSFSPGKAAGA